MLDKATRFAIVGVLLGGAALATAQENAPKLVLSQEVWDFGDVWHLERPSVMITVSNEGSAPLVIQEVTTSCGCTAANPERNVVPPGESTRVRVVYDTNGKQGKQVSKVMIKNNDPRFANRKQEAVVDVRGFVKRAVERDPLGGLVIRTLEGKPGASGTVRLKNTTSERMRPRLLVKTIRELDVQLREVEPGLIYDVVGRLNTRLKPGATVRGKIDVATGLSREETFTVHARVQILNSTEPSPPAMLFKGSDNAAASRRVSFHHYGDMTAENFRITGATCDHPGVELEIGEPRAPLAWMKRMDPPINATCDLQIKLPPPTSFPRQGIWIEVTTSDPQRPKVRLLATTNKPQFEKALYGG